LQSRVKPRTRPTMRAADGGWAPRFLAFFVALCFSRFDSPSTPAPTAANASRWAVGQITITGVCV